MSGGSFNYAYRIVEDFCEDLETQMKKSEDLKEFGSEVMSKLREIYSLSAKTAKLMREVEWLYSGDTGSKSFLERVKEIEAAPLHNL